SFAFGLLRRHCRSIRLPQGDPDCATAVHGGLGDVGCALLYEYCPGVACGRSAGPARTGRSDMGACGAVADSRYCWSGASPKRCPPQRDEPSAGTAVRTRRRCGTDAAVGSVAGTCRECPCLCIVVVMFALFAIYGTLA